jgi:hypothetical protein
MVPLLLPLVASYLPIAYEVDFGALPPANASPPYRYTLVIGLAGQPDYKVTSNFFAQTGPTEEANSFESFKTDDALWLLKRDGNRIVFFGYGDSRVTRITTQGKGPQPAVRAVPWLPVPPAKKQ